MIVWKTVLEKELSGRKKIRKRKLRIGDLLVKEALLGEEEAT